MGSKQNAVHSIGEVSRQINMPRWRLQYLIEKGTVPGPTFLVAGRRLFTDEDVERISDVLAQHPELRDGANKAEQT